MSYKFIYNDKEYDLNTYSSTYQMWKHFFNYVNMSDYGYRYTQYDHRQITYPHYNSTSHQNSKIHLIDINYKCQNNTMPFLIDCERTPIIPIRNKQDSDIVFSDGKYVIDLSQTDIDNLHTINFITKHPEDSYSTGVFSRQIHIERNTESGSDTIYTLVSDTTGKTTTQYKTTSSCITIVAQSAGGMGGSAHYYEYTKDYTSYSYGYANGGGGGSGAAIMFMIDLNHPTDNTQTFTIDINMMGTGDVTIGINSKLPSTSYPRIRLLLTPGEPGKDGLSNNIMSKGIPPGNGGQIYYFKTLPKDDSDDSYDVKDGYLITPSFPYTPEPLVYYMLPAITTNAYGLIYFMCPGQAGGYGRLTYLPNYSDDPNNGTEPSIESTTLDFKPGTNTIAVPVHKQKRTGDFKNCTRGEGGSSCTTQGAGGCGGYGYVTVDQYGYKTYTVDYYYNSALDYSTPKAYCFGQGAGVWISSTSEWTELK